MTRDVCAMSTYNAATDYDKVERKKKVDGKFQEITVDIPPAIKNDNTNMGEVDLSDQLIQGYQVLRRTRKWWKTLFVFFFISLMSQQQISMLFIAGCYMGAHT